MSPYRAAGRAHHASDEIIDAAPPPPKSRPPEFQVFGKDFVPDTFGAKWRVIGPPADLAPAVVTPPPIPVQAVYQRPVARSAAETLLRDSEGDFTWLTPRTYFRLWAHGLFGACLLNPGATIFLIVVTFLFLNQLLR